MIKYENYDIGFMEIPDKVSLIINLTRCKNRCIGCHSPILQKDIGVELDEKELKYLLDKNSGINCVVFMGEGDDQISLLNLIYFIKQNYSIKVAIYCGKNVVDDIIYESFDYVKIGQYIEKFGPLNYKTTNQKLFEIKNNKKIDITYKLQK